MEEIKYFLQKKKLIKSLLFFINIIPNKSLILMTGTSRKGGGYYAYTSVWKLCRFHQLFKEFNTFKTISRTPHWGLRHFGISFVLLYTHPITFTFSENSNYWRESLFEAIRQNIAGWCLQTFCFQKFVDNHSNVLPLHLQQSLPLPFKIFPTLIFFLPDDCL